VFTKRQWLGWLGSIRRRAPDGGSADAISERQQLYQELIDGVPQLLWTSRPDGELDFVNERWIEYTGVAANGHLGDGWLTQVHPDDRASVVETWRAARAAQNTMAVEFRLRRRDGVYRWFDARATPLFAVDGTVIRWFGSNLDVEDRRWAEQRFRRLYESNLIGIVFYESEGRLSDPNDVLLDMIGVSRADCQQAGFIWRQLVCEESAAMDRQQWEVLRRTGRCGPFECEFLRPDGRRVPVLVWRADLSPGEHETGVAIIVDLRRIKQAEDALRRTEAALRAANDSLEQHVKQRTAQLEAQTERLRALALDLSETESRERKRLARMLHDHFQQLVSAAKMKIGVIRRRSPDHPEVDALRQTESLLEEALSASRSLATELSPPVLHDTGLAAAFDWLVRRMKQNHNLIVRLSLPGWREPDNEQVRIILFECIRELLFNVVKHAGVESAELNGAVVKDGLLQISVRDRGKGFDPRGKESRNTPEGSFGLFSIRERLGLIGGIMKVASSIGAGTTVELTVPTTSPVRSELPAVAAESADTRASPGVTPRNIRVLVADDHKLFREGLISLLNQEPYLNIVAEAGDGQEAVDLARRLRPDIMIVDVTMPKLNGVQVTSMVSKELPGIKIIGLSMHEQDDMAQAMYNAGAMAYCAKSAPIESLVNILRNASAIG
jgi:PAS domain S-box-containing protein